MHRFRRGGFTLIELLVVVAIIALLISILIPSLQSAKEGGRRARCLANLRQLATGMHTYAAEDSRQIAFPVQPIYGDATTTGSAFSFVEYIFVSWWTWGGRDGTVPWAVSATARYYVREFNDAQPPALEPNPAHWKLYAARHRPLNRTLYPNGISSTGPDRFDMPIYECPADMGYPLDSGSVGEVIDDAPAQMRKIRCYDGLGNSYRGSFTSVGVRTGRSWFTAGPAGHRLDTIPATSDTVWFGDPMFFNMIGANSALPGTGRATLYFPGWHKKRAADNLAFVDGSARFTFVSQRLMFDSATYRAMEVDPTREGFLNRGPNYRLDVYPTSGAILMKPHNGNVNAVLTVAGDRALWPARAAQNNFDYSR